MTYQDLRLQIEAELAKLETVPSELAERHLGWRLIEAFVARDTAELLFWSVSRSSKGRTTPRSSGLRIVETGVRIDLLLTDVGLPGGMNGRQLADAVREQRPKLKVLFLTGYAESAAVRDRRMEQGMEIMTKPFALDALSAKIESMLSD